MTGFCICEEIKGDLKSRNGDRCWATMAGREWKEKDWKPVRGWDCMSVGCG